MLDLLLVGLFVSFFLALFDGFIAVLSVMMAPILVNTTFSLLVSVLGSWLVGIDFNKKFIVFTVGAAFLGRVILKGAERIILFRSAPVNVTGQYGDL